MNQSEESKASSKIESLRPILDEHDKEVTKHTIRKKVWEFMERNGFSIFPRPVYRRIPNFKGSEESAKKLTEIAAFVDCVNIEVNPDKPQEPARLICLENNKNLYVPVLRLKEGLLKQIIVPENSNKSALKQLVNRRGIEEIGKTISLKDSIHIDVLVLGSVAVSREGYRIGKGRGYADIEYAVLREINAIDENTIVVTNVHDSQVFDTLPAELFKEYDVPIDFILTPTELIKINHNIPKPKGIIWNILSQRRLNLMPILQELKADHESKGKDTTLKEVDTDVESFETQRFNKNRRFRHRRPQSFGRTSESQGEGDSAENKPSQHRQRFFRRKVMPHNDDQNIKNGDLGINNENENPVTPNRKSQRARRPFRRNKQTIDFSLMVSNIEKSVRVRDLKNALIERGIKPNDITWRGYKGFCYLHYAKPSTKTKTMEPYQVDNVIEILQTMKICPTSETNLNVKILEKISRIETIDVTAV